MTVLVRQRSDERVSISPVGFEDPEAGQLWIAGVDDVLVEGWREIIGCDGARPARYRLEWPAMLLFDDPFCPACKEWVGHCHCYEVEYYDFAALEAEYGG